MSIKVLRKIETHSCVCVYVKPTYGDIRGAVCLQEAVEVLPGLGYPVDDLNQVIAAHVLIDLRLYQLSPQEPAQETFDWFGVIRAQHPPGATVPFLLYSLHLR